MTLISVISLLLTVIILVCAWQGFKKGIIMGIIQILVIILSLYGAQLLSDTFSYEVIPVIKPFVSGYMDSQVEDTAYRVLGYEPDENGEYHVNLSLSDLMDAQPESRYEIAKQVYEGLGIYDDIAGEMADKVTTYAEQNTASIASSVVSILCQYITWYGGFLLGFIILFAILTVIVNLPNLSFQIPYIGIINNLGGLGIGIFVGYLFCALIVWFLQFTGLVLPESMLRLSAVADSLLNKNMLASYISF